MPRASPCALANKFPHELRTPLALKARSVRDTPAGMAQEEALHLLEQDARRAGEMLHHLLGLARANRAELHEAGQRVQPLGLGLGHRVVEKVAALHGAGFEPDIALPDDRRCWRLRFPPTPAGRQA